MGRYDLFGLLGQGGMASVHIGRMAGPAGFEKLVAVKIIHPHLLGEREFVSMFLDEARIAARIQHPNVAAITEMGEENGLLYMVGELVQGESLRNLIRRIREERASFPPPLAAYIVAKMCDGLHAAHELTDGVGRSLGIVHRDVSPQNVLVSYSGHVKLIDFGVARARDRITHTRSGTIKGKIGYLSPEQLRNTTIDRRSDVFSAGVVLYQLLAGAHPFPGDSDIQRLDRIARAEFRPPRELEPAVPPELEQVVMKAMARDPADRFPSAAAMARALGDANRASGERVGSTRLSAAMKWLFSREIAERVSSLEQHRGLATNDPGSSSRPLVDSRTRERWTSTGPVLEAGRVGTARRRNAVAVAGAVATALAVGIGLAALVLFPRGAEAPRVPETAVSGSRDDGAVLVPPSVSEETSASDVVFEFSVSPEGARLLLDNKPLPAGIRRLLLPGDGRSYVVTASAPGFLPGKLAAVADGDRLVDVRLVPAPPEGVISDAAGAAAMPEKARTRTGRRKAGRGKIADPDWAPNPF